MPDVFLLHIGLPYMNGNELARQLKAHATAAGTILIAASVSGREQDKQNAFAFGFDHYLTKPVGSAALTSLFASRHNELA